MHSEECLGSMKKKDKEEGTGWIALIWFHRSQVQEKEQLVQQLKEDIENEENNYKHQDNLQLCQVSQVFLLCSIYANLFKNVGALQTLTECPLVHVLHSSVHGRCPPMKNTIVLLHVVFFSLISHADSGHAYRKETSVHQRQSWRSERGTRVSVRRQSQVERASEDH